MLEARDVKKWVYVGTGAGLILFVLLGFFPSAMIGGYVGLKLAELIMGEVSSGILPRLLTALSMIGSVLVAAVTFILGGAAAGYLLATKVLPKTEEGRA